MLPVATSIQSGAPKINACVLWVRVLCKTRRSFIRSFSRLSYDESYLRTGVKGYSKIRRVLAKPRLILDEMCRLYGKFASYLRRVLCKTRQYFSLYKWPYMHFQVVVVQRLQRNVLEKCYARVNLLFFLIAFFWRSRCRRRRRC